MSNKLAVGGSADHSVLQQQTIIIRVNETKIHGSEKLQSNI